MRTIEKIVECLEACYGDKSCCKENHQCAYGDKGLIDCVERLNDDYENIMMAAAKVSTVSRLEEICTAEHEGRSNIYPVKQYSTIYYILDGSVYVGWYLAKAGETTHLVLQDKIEMGVCWVTDDFWFLTREAAEKALGERHG